MCADGVSLPQKTSTDYGGMRTPSTLYPSRARSSSESKLAWIKTISEDQAEGHLKREYDAAIKRAGRVFNIVKINSVKPDILRTFMQFYLKLMHGPSGLSRAQREMIAVVVSVLNKCHY